MRGFLAGDAALAVAVGGPYGWDPLTCLCFSRFLRIDRTRAEAFMATARELLDAGAGANTGWYESADAPNGRPLFESAIYGASGVARDAALTRLLLEGGADPNDEETPYHAPEGENDVMRVLLESGRLSENNRSVMLQRACDWHDLDGVRLLLEQPGDVRAVSKSVERGFLAPPYVDSATSSMSRGAAASRRGRVTSPGLCARSRGRFR